jgi:RHS repeat-associated protein
LYAFALEFTGSAVPSVRYLHGTMVDQVLAQEQGGQTSWMLTDQLGSVRDLVSNAGTVVGHFTYDSFGQVMSATGAVDSRYKFTGRELDSETGLYYYRARYYDARVGRFIGQDPIGFEAGDANLYRYVGNSPLNATDPSGLYSRNLQVLLALANDGRRRTTYQGYPKSPDYRTALITATNWFYLITVPNSRQQSNVQASPIGLYWGLSARLRNTSSTAHGGRANLRPFGASGDAPTIDLVEYQKKRHNTPGHERVNEIKFLFDKGNRQRTPCPPLLPGIEPTLSGNLPRSGKAGVSPIEAGMASSTMSAGLQVEGQFAVNQGISFPSIRIENPFNWLPPLPMPLPFGRQAF